MNENPYKAPIDQQDQPDFASHSSSPGAQEIYNVMSDTVTGVNVRWSDNKFQAYFVLVSMLLLAIVGIGLTFVFPQVRWPWYAGAGIGAFLGLVIGTIASGIYLMIYRAVQHIQGKHN